MPPVIATAESADLPAVREMLHEYQAWLAVDLCFQGFADEVANLPGDYAPPGGGLFVARLDQQPIGMVAFRRRDYARAEMKRLFVRPAARGSGAGHLLIGRVIDAARAAGYRTMILDTLPVMSAAQRMYEQFGFRDVPPYYESPIVGTRFMALAL